MRLVDRVNFKVCSGKGGDGIVSWMRFKYIPKGGPGGGDGGRGGSVYVRAVNDIEALRKYAGIKELKAQDGKPGRAKNKHGLNGEDLILEVPRGTVIKFDDKMIDLSDSDELVKILDGGKGGYGNTRFKSPSNRAPKERTLGRPARCVDLQAELRVIADIGIIGLPNAGKSSLLNTISNSNAKIGDYPFTTTEPNLGVSHGIVFADIPGLIEGASDGKGLGIKFLQHIKRTKILLHMVSVESQNPCKDYSLIRDELKKYDIELTRKDEIVVLSKTDLVDKAILSEKRAELAACSAAKELFDISVSDRSSIDALLNRLVSKFEKN